MSLYSMEMEADHVGLMLLAAAAYDPRVAPSVYEKLGKIGGGSSALDDYTSTHPSCKTRSQVLSQEHVMNKALELYFEASSSQHTEGIPLDSGAQQVIDDERQSINRTICAT
jgi:metalloendopeptidase OMA1, mitochondrial